MDAFGGGVLRRNGSIERCMGTIEVLARNLVF